jgi:hypothetical protein
MDIGKTGIYNHNTHFPNGCALRGIKKQTPENNETKTAPRHYVSPVWCDVQFAGGGRDNIPIPVLFRGHEHRLLPPVHHCI